jgi:peptidoglycan/xylan/chitin deacetylase (PgdA/CDA1 family)
MRRSDACEPPARDLMTRALRAFLVGACVALASAVGCQPPPAGALSVAAASAGPTDRARFTIDLARTRLLGAAHGVLLVGYDVEAMGPDETVEFLARAAALHRELGAAATFFPTGLTLEGQAATFRELDRDPLFEVETHTYTHERLTALAERRPEGDTFLPAASPAALARSLDQTARVARSVLGRANRGMTAPYGVYRGLVHRADLLEQLHALGVRFVRSYSRNADDWQPVPFDVQPFWYALQGYPDMLEIPIQGWQDVLWREANGWDDLAGYRALVDRELDLVSSRDLVWSYCGHDWGSLRADPDLTLLRHLLEGARRRGIVMATHAAFYDAARAIAEN